MAKLSSQKITLTKKQIRAAKEKGLSVWEAKRLIVETIHEQQLDAQTYAEMSEAEKMAHDNY